MANRESLAIGEWYHTYNRGVDKRIVFLDERDYEKFLTLMYLSTSSPAISIHASDIKNKKLSDILSNASIKLGKPIVEFGSYCLMPNHMHIAIKSLQDNGISLFMQRLFTGYTMYFNKKYNRTGALFAGTFKSKHVNDDRYFKYLVSYIHLNPAELFDIKWKKGKANITNVEKRLIAYRYSSLPDFMKIKRPENKLIKSSIFDLFEVKISLKKMIQEMDEYYESLGSNWEV